MDQQRQIELDKMSYSDYLATPEWQAKRLHALARDGHRCMVCNSSTRLNVHHRCYCRRGDETPDMLTTLCEDCHHLFHESGQRVQKQKRPRLPKKPAQTKPVRKFVLTEGKCHCCGRHEAKLHRVKNNAVLCRECHDVYSGEKKLVRQTILKFQKEYMATGNPKRHAANLAKKKYKRLYGQTIVGDFSIAGFFKTA